MILFQVSTELDGSTVSCVETSIYCRPFLVPIRSWHFLYLIFHSSLMMSCLRVPILRGLLPFGNIIEFCKARDPIVPVFICLLPNDCYSFESQSDIFIWLRAYYVGVF